MSSRKGWRMLWHIWIMVIFSGLSQHCKHLFQQMHTDISISYRSDLVALTCRIVCFLSFVVLYDGSMELSENVCICHVLLSSIGLPSHLHVPFHN